MAVGSRENDVASVGERREKSSQTQMHSHYCLLPTAYRLLPPLRGRNLDGATYNFLSHSPERTPKGALVWEIDSPGLLLKDLICVGFDE